MAPLRSHPLTSCSPGSRRDALEAGEVLVRCLQPLGENDGRSPKADRAVVVCGLRSAHVHVLERLQLQSGIEVGRRSQLVQAHGRRKHCSRRVRVDLVRRLDGAGSTPGSPSRASTQQARAAYRSWEVSGPSRQRLSRRRSPSKPLVDVFGVRRALSAGAVLGAGRSEPYASCRCRQRSGAWKAGSSRSVRSS